jgi:hypothetical protein
MNEKPEGNSDQTSNDNFHRRQEFINFLNAEISNLRNEIQRPGWTTWAILGSIAVLVWLLLDEIELSRYSIINVAFLLLVFFLVFVSYVLVHFLINPNPPIRSSQGRFMQERWMPTARIPLLFITILNALLVAATIILSPYINNIFATIISCIVFSYLFLLILLLNIIVYMKIPFPMAPKTSTRAKIPTLLIFILSLLSLWQYIRYILTSSTFNIFDLRFAFIIFAILILFLLLVRKPSGFLTLENLTNTRRDYFLKYIDLNTAIKYVDITFTGYRAADVLEPYFNKLFEVQATAIEKMKEFTSILEELETFYKNNKEPLTKEQSETRHSIIKSLAKSSEESDLLINQSIPKALYPLEMRLMFVKKFIGSDNNLDELDKKLQQYRDDLVSQMQIGRDRFRKFIKDNNIDIPLQNKS